MDPAFQSNVILLPLFRGLAVTTTGVALGKSVLDIDVARVRALLPRCTALFLVGLVENVPSTDLEFNVGFFSAYDRDHHPVSPIDIAATPITSASPQGTRSLDYTTTANFLPDTRLQAWWRNPAGVSGAKSGLISAILGARLSS